MSPESRIRDGLSRAKNISLSVSIFNFLLSKLFLRAHIYILPCTWKMEILRLANVFSQFLR